MATHKSAIKRARQNEKRRQRNKNIKTRVRTMTKEARTAINKTPETAEEALRRAMSGVDKAAAKGAVHPKTAARKIARLSRALVKARSESGGQG